MRRVTPAARSRAITLRLGAPRMSSVSGLNATPSTPTVFPRRPPIASSSFWMRRSTREALIRSTSRSRAKSRPASAALQMNAFRSFVKHDPPYPSPACRK